MPEPKLYFGAMTIESLRMVVLALRRSGSLLLPLLLVGSALQIAGDFVFPGASGLSVVKLAPALASLVITWLVTILFMRATLQNRSGSDLMRADRSAWMLLGLMLIEPALQFLTPAPPTTRLGMTVLVSVSRVVFQIAWARATYLLAVGWALGETRMTIARSWRGLGGNFLRILGFWFVWGAVLVVLVLAGVYAATGKIQQPERPFEPLAVDAIGPLFMLLPLGVQAAVYRLLDGRRGLAVLSSEVAP